jgi:Cys-tRNA(Pro) deacylase
VKPPPVPVTPAVRALRAAGVAFVPHVYAYVERGGTRHSAEALGVPEHSVIKTLCMEARGKGTAPKPLLVLMHGDRDVSTRELARQIGAREVSPASVAAVEKHTGYVPGGVSPLGTRKALPVFVEASVLKLPTFYVNGGKRGFLVEIRPDDLVRLVSPTPVRVAIVKGTTT